MVRHRKGIFAYITVMVFMLQILGVSPLVGIANAQPTFPITSPDDARTHGLESLKTAIQNDGGVPLPGNLKSVVKDFDTLLVLGKALFWDMRVGSDNVQACASCHFHAGADNRVRNQLHSLSETRVEKDRDGNVIGYHDAASDPDDEFQPPAGALSWGPDHTLVRNDFPFVRDIGNGANVVTSGNTVDPAPGNSNDVASSMGVFLTLFGDINPGGDPLLGAPDDPADPQPPEYTDPIFNLDDSPTETGEVRRVEPRNTPTTIGAVLNFTNFWDGRANNDFNGFNTEGKHDRDSQVFERRGKNITTKILNLKNSSLASQAVGPPLSFFEMSFDGRIWPDVGEKMLPLRALAGQVVDEDDSVLGPHRDSGSGTGLTMTYMDLVEDAFKNKYWDDSGLNLAITFPNATLQGQGNNVVFKPGAPEIVSTRGNNELPEGYSLAEANFSMFFGIAVMWYEATLVPDRTPFDKWMEGDGSFVTEFGADELAGLNVFVGKGKCINCHAGPEFTNASVRNAQGGNNVIEPMLMGDNNAALYDNGFYNIGVTPTVDDLGRGNKFGNGDPLAFSRQFAFDALGIQNINFPIIGAPIRNLVCDPDDTLDCDANIIGFIDELSGNFFPVCEDVNGDGLCGVKDNLLLQRVAVDGAFKTPALRNVELTGPFMHNGGLATLLEVVEFYDRGGNFCRFNKLDLDPDIQGIGFSPTEETNLVDFLISLTDPRVKKKSEFFDHPELLIPNGGPKIAQAPFIVIDAVGKSGAPPADWLKPFLDADQFSANPVVGGICSPDFPTF